MTAKEVEIIVDGNIKYLMARYGIPNWKIEVIYDECDNVNWGAQCERSNDYCSATITINPARADSEKEILELLQHELLHLVLAPFDLYRDTMTQHLVNFSSPAAKREQCIWRHAVEQTVRTFRSNFKVRRG